jgi:KipI family sensor histidine kinase inhibitor
MELEAFGDAAWRVRLPEDTPASAARALLDALRATPGVVDVVVSERHVLVVPASTSNTTASAVRAVLEREPLALPPPRAPKEHRVRVRYDGADLDDVARAAGLSPADVVAVHASARYEVAVIGFLPGFAYLRGLDPRLVLPRRTTPRTRVPAFSVAIAGPYSGVYPFPSPGGWHLLGTADGFAPFDARVGAAFAIGDRVVFEAAR